MRHYEISKYVDSLNSKKPVYSKRFFIDEVATAAVFIVAVAIIFRWLFWC